MPPLKCLRSTPSGVFSCWPDGLKLTPGFYPRSNEQHRLFWASIYLKHTRSRVTSASSALGVLNDYALYKSTHSLTHSIIIHSEPVALVDASCKMRKAHILEFEAADDMLMTLAALYALSV